MLLWMCGGWLPRNLCAGDGAAGTAGEAEGIHHILTLSIAWYYTQSDTNIDTERERERRRYYYTFYLIGHSGEEIAVCSNVRCYGTCWLHRMSSIHIRFNISFHLYGMPTARVMSQETESVAERVHRQLCAQCGKIIRTSNRITTWTIWNYSWNTVATHTHTRSATWWT